LGPFAVGAAREGIHLVGRAPRSALAARVTTYVHTLLAPRVLLLEHAWTLANRQVQAYCDAQHQAVSVCFEQEVDPRAPALRALGDALTQQALTLRGACAGFTLLPAPHLGTDVADRQMDHLLEDLGLLSTQLAGVLEDHAQAIVQMTNAPLPNPRYGTALQGLAYAPRVRDLLATLRRAEGWLESIDQETGAHATLPGFEPGAPSIEIQLGIP
jgi:hypothetical protein